MKNLKVGLEVVPEEHKGMDEALWEEIVGETCTIVSIFSNKVSLTTKEGKKFWWASEHVVSPWGVACPGCL